MIKDSSGVLHPVLSIFPFSNNNLFVGAGTGSGGSFNTFSGANAGSANVNGNYNTSSGANAGFANLNGGLNTFSGAYAGYYNKFSRNTFSGFGAGIFNGLFGNGDNNTYYGYEAGISNFSGNNNIYLGHTGFNESNTIRIGMIGGGFFQQNKVFIDPILLHLTNTTLDAVTIDSLGQLGHTPFPTGGLGNVVGPTTCLANYLTKWTGVGPNVTCSKVYETPEIGRAHV